MVCSPHRYIVSGIAAGGTNYSTEKTGIPYQRLVYSNRYAEPTYETKKQTAFDYARQKLPDTQERIEETRTPYTYSRFPTIEELPNDLPTFSTPLAYTPLSSRSIFQQNQIVLEAPMTNQNIRQTKQKLAQRIMQELDALGPREEHTHDHEHGEHTHVH